MSARIHQAHFDEALRAFQFFTAWWGGWVPLQLRSWKPSEIVWRQGPPGPGHSRDLVGMVRFLDEHYDDEILLGMPQERPNNGGVGRASVLWCRVEGKDQLARARRFHPRPSLVLAEGTSTRRWLFWPLERPVSYFEVKPANRKIAYHLRAMQKWGDPDRVWFPAPGTCLRAERSRPVPVVVARLTQDVFELDAVVGRLREPPEVDWWRESAGRG